MPTYDYRCKACGHELEIFHRMSDKPKRKCPECGKMQLERLIGAGGAVLFKGSGFYETDYRSESYRKAAKAEQEKQTGSSSSSSDSGSGNGSGGGDSCACGSKSQTECGGSSSASAPSGAKSEE